MQGDKLKDEHKRSQEKLSQTKNSSSTEKLAVEKSSSSNPPSNSKTKDISKSTFGKPFPTKSDINSAPEESSTKGKKDDESGNSTKPDSNGPETKKDGNSEGAITKKRIVKRVIRVRKIKDGTGVENADDIASSQQSGSSDVKPKKVVRVVRKSTKSDDGGNIKTESEGASKKVDAEKGSSGDGDKMDSKDADKERKNKRGRPEIQIYRPGSLRGAPKPASSTGEKDKERKSDNN